MKLAIMQPYFFPYIGYFQLIGAVDEFVIYDNIKYTKKGWINRNRFLSNGSDALFSIPLAKDSDFLDIRERTIADSFDKARLLNQLAGAYAKSPQFKRVFPVVEEIILSRQTNLFEYVFESVKRVCGYLEIGTRFVVSSTVPVDHGLKGQEKVVALCKASNALTYINPIGGVDLYDRNQFAHEGIALKFLKTGDVQYAQLGEPFVPSLSIIDVMMFNSVEHIRTLLQLYTFV